MESSANWKAMRKRSWRKIIRLLMHGAAYFMTHSATRQKMR